MSLMDMRPDAQRPNDNAPIVVAINTSAQNYLTSTNAVLEAFYGSAPRRVCVTLPDAYVRPRAESHHLQLLHDRPYMTYDSFVAHIQRPTWIVESLLVPALRRLISAELHTDWEEWTDRVRVVLVGESLLEAGTSLQLLVDEHPEFNPLPSAVWFQARERQIPGRIRFAPPPCHNCSVRMRDADNCFVCEGCGNVQGKGNG